VEFELAALELVNFLLAYYVLECLD